MPDRERPSTRTPAMPGSVLFMILRRLRAPMLLLVVVFAVGIAGLVLIPGVDAQGQTWHLTLFQALYFMSYTASTIGFGEIPQGFSDNQRLWVTVIIYASVIGWAILVASLLAMVQDRAFAAALATARFPRAVRSIGEPFLLICGFGETGLLLARALDRLGMRFVVIELEPERAQAIELLQLTQEVPTLADDARVPEHLLMAGLAKRECQGVLALTNDDKANLAVAMTVRLLNPRIPVLARAMTRQVAANMASFGTDGIINPFTTFGGYLALAVESPGSYRLLSWLTGAPGTSLKPETAPPRGRWVVCGYGRFGREVVEAFQRQEMNITVVDPNGCDAPDLRTVIGLGTDAEPLLEAGIEHAVGVIAGTDDDVNNLSIAVTARELNPRLFTIVRQNLQSNHALFEAYKADITMVSSEIVANECLAVLKTPRLATFLQAVRGHDDAWADRVVERLIATVGVETPEIWGVAISASGAPAIHRAVMLDRRSVSLGALDRDPEDRERVLPCVPLAIVRDGSLLEMPEQKQMLCAGDEVLYAGTPAARRSQWLTLHNLNVRDYVLDGKDLPGGWIWQWWARRREGGRSD